MTGGFAIFAYPAEYANSGVMSFVVDQHGIVLQKDLGADTAESPRQSPHSTPTAHGRQSNSE